MKYTSIPMLELAAAVLSTTMSGLVKKDLGFDLMTLQNIAGPKVKL